MTIRSNWYMLCNRLMNVLNVLVMADSGVTNIMDAVLCGLRLSYCTHSIQASLHRLSKSSCNEHNGIITTVVPPLTQYAGNINNKLFPSPVAITLTIGLCPVMMACMVFSCKPRNSAFCPINSFNLPWMLTWHICLNRRNCTSRPMCSYLLRGLFIPALIPNPWMLDSERALRNCLLLNYSLLNCLLSNCPSSNYTLLNC